MILKDVPPLPPEWIMYDVPVTFSVRASSAGMASAYVAQQVDKINRDVLQAEYLRTSPAYSDDHAFRDGDARPCDCMGH